ncbi:MAG: Npt1/Npt2 family nucleotide transporter, partial [Myxococcota bacterium]
MNSADRATAAATAAALLAVAGQVAGKAARDALFLSSFSITDLPTVVIASSIVSVIVVVATARLFSTFGPATVVPTAFVLSAVLLLVEWSLLERMPRVIAIAAYLHFAVFGLVLISGIWSVVNERFDPRTAKARVGRIALGATVGGVLGGLLAERVAAMYSLAALLPILSLISVAGAGLVVLIGRDPSLRKQKPPAEPSRNGFAVLGKNRYLREIAALLLVVTVAAGFLDYVFKAEASAALEDREVLMRFFAGFYTALGVATFLIQSTLANSVLRRFGIARTVSVLPAAVALGAVGLVAAPGLIAATLARGGESALRSSLFRTGYELLYTPVSEADRRATKTIIDAGFDRLGDAVAGGLITVLLLVLPTGGTAVLVVGAGICGVVAMLLAMDLHRGYVASLEARLLEQADDVEIDPTDDVLRTSAVMQTYATLDLRQFVQSRRVQAPAARTAEARSVPAAPKDPVVARLGELRSSDSEQVIKAILDPRRLERPHAAAMVELLARDDMSAHVVQVLRASMPRFAGLLLDA